MNLIQHLLGKLAEEASEVGKIALKTQQFGMDEKMPSQPFTNAERIHQELDDLMAGIQMLNERGLGYTPNEQRIGAKIEKVTHYLKYSVDLGMVDQNALEDLDP